MANESPSTSSTPPQNRRRSSFAGQTFADLFGSGGSGGPGGPGAPGAQRGTVSRGASDYSPPPAQSYQGPITSAAAQAQSRRLSLTTLGLSGSPNQTSPFNSRRTRRDSDDGSANSSSIDESAIEDEMAPGGTNSTPQTPFARRMSFGARALRDVRTGGPSGGVSPGQNGNTRPSASSAAANTPTSPRGDKTKGRGSNEGFNWSENFRTRAERTASGAGLSVSLPSPHGRSKSVAVVEPPAPPDIPKSKPQVRPDHFQERILKGDFYMD